MHDCLIVFKFKMSVQQYLLQMLSMVTVLRMMMIYYILRLMYVPPPYTHTHTHTQVSTLFKDGTIGGNINIVLVGLILLDENQVSVFFSGCSSVTIMDTEPAA